MKDALIALFAKENRKFFWWGIGVYGILSCGKLFYVPSIIYFHDNTKQQCFLH